MKRLNKKEIKKIALGAVIISFLAALVFMFEFYLPEYQKAHNLPRIKNQPDYIDMSSAFK